MRAGVSQGTARDIVRLARRTQELPEAAAALSEGTLSLDQSAVLSRHVPPTHSAAATDFARTCTVTQLRRALSKYGWGQQKQEEARSGSDQDDHDDQDDPPARQPTPGEEAGPFSVREEPNLRMSTSEEGVFTLHFTGPASVGVLIEQAIREAKGALFNGGSHQATLGDALVEVANRSLSTIDGTARGRKFRINVHLGMEGGWLPGVGRVPDHMLRRLICEGELVPIWEREGSPVSVGRSSRVVPERLRRLVVARDVGCAYPACGATGHVDVHHVVHWGRGGATDLDNLVALCSFHHDRHHAGEFGIEADPDHPGRFVFTGRGGWRLEPLAAVPEPTRPRSDIPHDIPHRDPGPPADEEPVWIGPSGGSMDTAWVHIMPNPPPTAA